MGKNRPTRKSVSQDKFKCMMYYNDKFKAKQKSKTLTKEEFRFTMLMLMQKEI